MPSSRARLPTLTIATARTGRSRGGRTAVHAALSLLARAHRTRVGFRMVSGLHTPLVIGRKGASRHPMLVAVAPRLVAHRKAGHKHRWGTPRCGVPSPALRRMMARAANGGPAQAVRGFAFDGSPRFFSSGIAHPRTPTPKDVILWAPLFFPCRPAARCARFTNQPDAPSVIGCPNLTNAPIIPIGSQARKNESRESCPRFYSTPIPAQLPRPLRSGSVGHQSRQPVSLLPFHRLSCLLLSSFTLPLRSGKDKVSELTARAIQTVFFALSLLVPSGCPVRLYGGCSGKRHEHPPYIQPGHPRMASVRYITLAALAESRQQALSHTRHTAGHVLAGLRQSGRG